MRPGRRAIVAGGLAALAAPARGGPPGSIAVARFVTVISGVPGTEGLAIAADGRLFFSRGAGDVAMRLPDGTIRLLAPAPAPAGLALDRQGRLLVANVGLLHGLPGPLQRVDPATGVVEVLADKLDGRMLVASNVPVVARDGTIYCTHSKWDDVQAVGATDTQGFVYRVAPGGAAEIVARGLAGANGCCFDRDERYLYVALTPLARIVRLRRLPGGGLGPAERYGPSLGDTTPGQTIAAIRALSADVRARLGYCDGISFDAAGNLWVTLPFANRIVALTPAGRLAEIVRDSAGAAIAMPTNLAWGGVDRRILHVVSRANGAIVAARSDVAGLPT